MTNLAHKLKNRALRKNRIRSTVNGTTERPRLTVYVSNLHITAQVIDDSKQTTLAYATTVGKKGLTGTMSEKAAAIGEELAKTAKAAKVTKVTFDRGGRLYHGRVKALADAARKSGLEF
jgi:large subunit ribosomal protein L18